MGILFLFSIHQIVLITDFSKGDSFTASTSCLLYTSKKCVKRDFKKEDRALYQPGTEPRILDVPDLLFLMVDGTGDPNTSAAYQEAIEMLYGLSYEIKMSPKKGAAPQGYYDYVVPPLEGLWTTKEAPQDNHILDKKQFSWTSLIRQPEFVTRKVLDAAKERFAKKKPELDLSKVRLEDVYKRQEDTFPATASAWCSAPARRQAALR